MSCDSMAHQGEDEPAVICFACWERMTRELDELRVALYGDQPRLVAEVSLAAEDLKRQPSRIAVEALLDAKLAMTRERLLEEVEGVYAQFVSLPPEEPG